MKIYNEKFQFQIHGTDRMVKIVNQLGVNGTSELSEFQSVPPWIDWLAVHSSECVSVPRNC